VLVLALDTATPAVTAGVVELTAAGATTRSCRVAHDPRKHGELLMPAVLAACTEAVTGAGPGPFTGLRVGMMTAAALGDALEVPVHAVCTLDAIARDAGPVVGGNLLVVTDARRREVYWAAYDTHARRLSGPHVERPADLAARIAELGVVAAAGWSAEGIDLPVRAPGSPSPGGLVAVAAEALASGTVPGPLEPLYLRRPDAVEPGRRKAVSAR
jgi:tRNA threonylcarbamoyl adenosine modification protein YeaZ